MKPEVVATGIRLGEGPTWRPNPNDLLVTSVADGLVWRLDPATGTAERFADTAGGPNSSALCDDGGVLITQNGGIDVSGVEALSANQFAPPRYVTPCIQRVAADGSVSTLTSEGSLQGPNDLVVVADGSVVFTDPRDLLSPAPDPDTTARVLRYRPEGAAPWASDPVEVADRLEVIDEFDHYLNGIALSPDGRLLTIEGQGLRWLDPDGGREWLVEDLGGGVGDGMTFDADGRVYVCMPGVGLRVLDPDGTQVEELDLPEGAVCLNCCFGGDDLRTLFVTNAGHGTVLAFEGMPAQGMLAHPFQMS